MLPKRSADRFAFGFLIFGSCLTIWYETCLILPSYDSTTLSVNLVLHHFIIAFLVVQIYLNLYYTLASDSSWSFEVRMGTNFPETKDWSFCGRCQSVGPPRSHHCPSCDQCVLKRDHHCWFVGTCIGHFNHRYYLVMVMYMWLAAVYCNVINYVFVRDTLDGWSLGTVLCMIMPHVSIVLGYFSLYQCFVSVMSIVGFVVMGMLTWLVQIQLVQIYHGRTWYEHKKGIDDYNFGITKNVQEILGEKSILITFLIPFVKTKLHSNGITFESKRKLM